MNDDDERVNVGARLRQERERAGLSIAGVARLTGIAPKTIGWLERESAKSLEYVAALAEVYGVCPGELFGVQCEAEEEAPAPAPGYEVQGEV